mmetsp:Transcript_25153/g.52219  ORF Transcript_25153/g.52219 Transcript_25153/m.52219 type:complete len:217 (-) Transcript_25153:383-1033(-)
MQGHPHSGPPQPVRSPSVPRTPWRWRRGGRGPRARGPAGSRSRSAGPCPRRAHRPGSSSAGPAGHWAGCALGSPAGVCAGRPAGNHAVGPAVNSAGSSGGCPDGTLQADPGTACPACVLAGTCGHCRVRTSEPPHPAHALRSADSPGCQLPHGHTYSAGSPAHSGNSDQERSPGLTSTAERSLQGPTGSSPPCTPVPTGYFPPWTPNASGIGPKRL